MPKTKITIRTITKESFVYNDITSLDISKDEIRFEFNHNHIFFPTRNIIAYRIEQT